uniref:Uncharacterized protein n=1 Tax=Arion vulgaris TaxID=1028688 RepID=A0A0B7AR64_9EUPU
MLFQLLFHSASNHEENWYGQSLDTVGDIAKIETYQHVQTAIKIFQIETEANDRNER